MDQRAVCASTASVGRAMERRRADADSTSDEPASAAPRDAGSRPPGVDLANGKATDSVGPGLLANGDGADAPGRRPRGSDRIGPGHRRRRRRRLYGPIGTGSRTGRPRRPSPRLVLRPLGGLLGLALAGQASVASYTIQRGETLSAIARKTGVSTRQLAAANRLPDPDRIRAGQRILIPDVRSGSTPNDGSTAVQYVAVHKGDTVTSVARRSGLGPRTLVARNGIVDGRLYYGAALRVSPYPWEPLTGRPAPFKMNRFRCPVPSADFMNDWGFARSGDRHHAGTDLFAPRGTPVLAPVIGTVERAPNRLGGHAVALVTGAGVRLYFAHLERYGRVGHVHAGDVIGYVGNSGGARGGPPHLHLEIRPDGRHAVNPYPTIRAACG